jgi:hypothetical protein
MKKVKIQSKLSLNKMTVAKLNDEQSREVVGGALSWIRCGTNRKNCQVSDLTRGIFCNRD